MFGLIVQLGILAVSIAASYYLKKSLAGRKAEAINLDVPRAEEGDPVPLAYGRVRISSPIVVSQPEGSFWPENTGTQVHYQAMMRFVLCLSNHRVGETAGGARFISMLVGDKELPILAGPGIYGYSDGPGESYVMHSGDILGDEGGEDHGTHGTLLFYPGRWDQTRYGNDRWSTDTISELPAYRGQVAITLAGSNPGDSLNRIESSATPGSYYVSWYFGDSPTLPPYSFIVENPVTIPGYEDVTAPIGNGDANPAAVIYDVLTNPFGRVGLDPALVDVDSFADVAATLRDEEHGISIVFAGSEDAQRIVRTILDQIDGVMYVDPATGKLVLGLIREDYVVADLPVVTTSNVIGKPKKPGTLWAGTVNVVRVTWSDPSKGYRDAVATADDPANVAAQGGYQRPRDFAFPGVTNPILAYFLANRELNFLSRPLERLEITVNRTMHGLRPGDPFVFSWPAWNGYSNVFRVMDLDHGTREDGSIKITAVQDRFSFPANVTDPPDTVGPSDADPLPIVDRLITEAPRWVQLQAYNAGALLNLDGQRGYYLAAPVSPDSRYRVEADVDGAGSVADSPARPFPGTFSVSTAYDSRSKAGYDTVTGIVIDDVVGWTPTAASTGDIATDGVNLIQIGGEILAFETVTGTGPYTLGNVWPALLDTVPALHPVGEVGYVLPGPRARGALGIAVLPHGATVETLTAASYGSRWTPPDTCPADEFTARSRVLLSYPAAKLLANGSATPTALDDDEGVAFTFRDRTRLATTITRGDASSETLEGGTTFDAVAYKGDGDQVTLSAAYSSGTTKVALGAAGHGALEVGVDVRRVVTLPDATTPTLGGWQVPTLPITAHHYRNLLLNPRFADGTGAGWTWTIGTPAVGTSNALGAAGSYITGASGTTLLDGYQTRSIAGYDPADLRARLRFAAVKNPARTGTDTATVYLYSLDAAGTVLDTQTYGPTAASAWTWNTLEIANLDPDTASIKVRVVLTGGGATVTSAVTELDLRVGQMTGQLLANPSFEDNPVVPVQSWTETVGTWQGLSATKYGSPTYVRPNDGASAQLRQAVSITTGYEGGAATLICGRMNDAASDTGKVTLAALDGGGSVLATTATADEAISPSNAWARRYLALELPATTATVRVQLDATRVSGTPLNACFDDFELRLHKHLDPDESVAIGSLADDGADPVGATQRLPENRYQWYRDFPGVLAPNHAIYAGSLVGKIGTEPLLEIGAGDGTTALATMVADLGLPSGAQTVTAYESASRGAPPVQVSPIGSSFANFSSAQPFAMEIFFRVAEPTWGGVAVACGRWRQTPTTLGWMLIVDDDGHPAIVLTGSTDEVTVTGSQVVTAGDLQGVAVHYDPLTTTVTLIDAAGTYTADCSAAGNWRTDDVRRMALWGGVDGLYDSFPGQIARWYAWINTTPSVSDLQSTLTFATTPAALLVGDLSPRTGSIACVIGEADTGVLVDTFGPGRVPVGYLQGFDRRGLLRSPDAPNLTPSAFTGDWTASGGTVTSPAGVVGPDGYATPALITGTNAQGYLLSALALGSAGSIYVQGFARGATAHTARVVCKNNSGSTVDTQDFTVTTTWQPFRVVVAWDGSTSGIGKLLFCGSSTGSAATIYLSPLLYVGTQPLWPGTVPIGDPGPTYQIHEVTLTERANREGELAVELVADVTADSCAAHLWNGSDAHDARAIAWAGGADVVGSHATGAGSNTDATITGSAADPSEPHTLRLRWNRAGLVDGTASEWTSVRAEQGGAETATGRTATWSASTSVVTKLDVGHDNGSDVLAGLVFGISVKSREPRL